MKSTRLINTILLIIGIILFAILPMWWRITYDDRFHEQPILKTSRQQHLPDDREVRAIVDSWLHNMLRGSHGEEWFCNPKNSFAFIKLRNFEVTKVTVGKDSARVEFTIHAEFNDTTPIVGEYAALLLRSHTGWCIYMVKDIHITY